MNDDNMAGDSQAVPSTVGHNPFLDVSAAFFG